MLLVRDRSGGVQMNGEMMKLFACLGSGNCMKPWLALNQLGIPFELNLVDVLKGEQSSAPFLAINPQGVVPYLITDEHNGIGESNAMLWYICEDTALMPQTTSERAEALQWMFFEQTKLEPFISPARFFNHILPSEKTNRAADISDWQEKARPGLKDLDTHLAKRTFMLEAGYSIADIAIFGYVHVLEEAGLNGADIPNVMRWIEDVRATVGFVELGSLGLSTANAA